MPFRSVMMSAALGLAATLIVAIPVSAQSSHADGCARDVSRLCRAQMNDGDMVVLSCLKQNRARLSKACAKVLADNGQ